METITVNGKEYIERGATPIETRHIIVIAQRGWIFEGYRQTAIKDKIRLLGASVVRCWSNGRGIGGLTKEDYKDEYTLDPVGQVEFAPEGVIAVISCEW